MWADPARPVMLRLVEIDIRVIRSDDWAVWRTLRLEALEEAPYAFGSRLADWQRADESRWRSRLELEGSHSVMAFMDARPVGMASGVPGDAAGEAQVISMYVAAGARGTGVSEALLDAVAAWAVDRGYRTLCLDVRADNARARRVYERNGFAVTGEVQRSTSDEPLELRMCRSLRHP